MGVRCKPPAPTPSPLNSVITNIIHCSIVRHSEDSTGFPYIGLMYIALDNYKQIVSATKYLDSPHGRKLKVVINTS